MIQNEIDRYRKASYDIDREFIERWSPRSFQEKEIPEALLFSLFEAAHWAPSAMNLQPWRFILARSEEDRKRFYSFVFDSNRAWCEKAPVLAIIVSKKTNDKGRDNRTHAFDTGAAWGFLTLQAYKKGLIVHGMGGFDKEAARKVLSIPKTYEIHAVAAIGYQDEKEKLPEKYQEREFPSERKPLKEIVFEGTWPKTNKD
ncbi:MAG TPA: nitroreductase family protein [Bacillales bacterium]|nr:nitroreductase family protein [Bacillales bacterium]